MRNFLNLRRFAVLFCLLCTACGTALPSVKPFKLDVQQGNVVTSKMLLQLRPGMTKSQVRFIMGSPLIQDSFHGNRWDYAYQLRENGKLKEQRRVILDFENDVLKTVRGDVVPAGSEAAKALRLEADAAAAVTKKQEERSMLDKLKFWSKDGESTPSNATPASITEPKIAKEAIVNSQIALPEALLENQTDVSDEFANQQTTNSLIAADDNTNEVITNDAPSILAVPILDPPVVADTLSAAPAVALVPATIIAISEDLSSSGMPVQEDLPFNTSTYESEAGMIFDRSLKITPLDAATIATQFVGEESEAGAKSDIDIPAPKPLPAESEPGFFDRMLERIGF
jgi:outer membrane protein assembly factor BamE